MSMTISEMARQKTNIMSSLMFLCKKLLALLLCFSILGCALGTRPEPTEREKRTAHQDSLVIITIETYHNDGCKYIVDGVPTTLKRALELNCSPRPYCKPPLYVSAEQVSRQDGSSIKRHSGTITFATAAIIIGTALLAKEGRIPGNILGGNTTVYITNTGTKYHRAGCKYLKDSSIPIMKSEAKKLGYTACSVCKP